MPSATQVFVNQRLMCDILPTFQYSIIPPVARWPRLPRRCAPRNGRRVPGSSDPRGGIMQNKANFLEPRLMLTAVLEKVYGKKMRIMPLKKQSQFSCQAGSVPVRAYKERVAGVSPAIRKRDAFDTGAARMATTQTPDGVTTSSAHCAKQSQFAGAQICANFRWRKELWERSTHLVSMKTKPISRAGMTSPAFAGAGLLRCEWRAWLF